MGRFSMYLSVGVLLMVAATPTQCQQPPPPGSVPYVTRAGDTPYRIAERIYGKGYLQDRIILANSKVLQADGTFPPGITIAIPPGLNGEPVDTSKFLKNP
jgi:nucleoid-associated protein YgaU